MMTGELQAAVTIPSLLNLDIINECQRAEAWRSGARTYFPGLSVRDLSLNPAVGMIAGTRLGAGRLWTIVSPPLQVCYDPAMVSADRAEIFSMMLQLRGSTLARQSNRSALLNPGEMCLIDSHAPFELSVSGTLSHIIVMQMPRRAVFSRHPHLEQHTAEVFDSEETGAALLRSVLLNIAESAPTMEADQCSAALGAVIQLVGAPRVHRVGPATATEWRVRTALAFIDTCLADAELTAEQVAAAQCVSRRRLDEIMVCSTGFSVSAHIWSRRLEQAASDLLDERFASRTVTQIAFASGFEDGAHFTRAFKRRYHVPPSGWRSAHRSGHMAPATGALKRCRD